MSGGDWHPSLDLLRQLGDAFVALEENPPEWPPAEPYQPEPRDGLPPLMRHQLSNGRIAVEPTAAEHDAIMGFVRDGGHSPREWARFEWRYEAQSLWLRHFGGLDPGPCGCPRTSSDSAST